VKRLWPPGGQSEPTGSTALCSIHSVQQGIMRLLIHGGTADAGWSRENTYCLLVHFPDLGTMDLFRPLPKGITQEAPYLWPVTRFASSIQRGGS
jgi:hypothetical protein